MLKPTKIAQAFCILHDDDHISLITLASFLSKKFDTIIFNGKVYCWCENINKQSLRGYVKKCGIRNFFIEDFFVDESQLQEPGFVHDALTAWYLEHYSDFSYRAFNDNNQQLLDTAHSNLQRLLSELRSGKLKIPNLPNCDAQSDDRVEKNTKGE